MRNPRNEWRFAVPNAGVKIVRRIEKIGKRIKADNVCLLIFIDGSVNEGWSDVGAVFVARKIVKVITIIKFKILSKLNNWQQIWKSYFKDLLDKQWMNSKKAYLNEFQVIAELKEIKLLIEKLIKQQKFISLLYI